MGYLFMAGLISSMDYSHPHRPETAGERLDRELRERDEAHRREIRDLEEKVERLKWRQALGL